LGKDDWLAGSAPRRLGALWSWQEVKIEERSFVAALLWMTAKGGWWRGDRFAAAPERNACAIDGPDAGGVAKAE
jgi:hypothetical protein